MDPPVAPDFHFKASLKDTFWSPFTHFSLFLRFSSIPIVATIAADFSFGLIATLVKQPFVFGLAFFVVPVMIPFNVAWTRLSVIGPGSVARRAMWSFGKSERNVLLLSIGVLVAMIACASIAAGLIKLLTKSTPGQ
ncbi:MAG TPA: hypothetical protein VMT61_02400 [Candidatus Binataceae bacterium]|nr:hypothetical protein [Candidatus Binataceae bacterium]